MERIDADKSSGKRRFVKADQAIRANNAIGGNSSGLERFFCLAIMNEVSTTGTRGARQTYDYPRRSIEGRRVCGGRI